MHMPTPIKSDVLHTYIEGYIKEEVQFLIDGFTFGFRIPISGKSYENNCKNHPSAIRNKSEVNKKLNVELGKGRILGPFVTKPIGLVCSPLALVPKKEPDKYRLIHDLSYPKGCSINSVIEKEHTKVLYDSIDIVVEKVRIFGRYALMAKTDIEDAFRLIPIHPEDRYLLGFSWFDEFDYPIYFMDACLPMGLSSSCQLFSRFSAALQWVMEMRHKSVMSHMLDDFFFVGPSGSDICMNSLSAFLEMCRHIDIPIKEEKTVVPCTCIIIYGIEVDSGSMETRLPDDKVTRIITLLKDMKVKKKVTLRDLQSMTGLLNFACTCVVPGRTFIRRLYDLTIGVSCPNHFIRLNKQARADLQMWHKFMQQFNGRCMFLHDQWLASDSLNLYTDSASTVGCAGVFGSLWFAERWSDDFKQNHINLLELFPIVVAVEIWGHLMANHKITFYSDNTTTVFILNKQTSKDPKMMQLVRRLVLATLQHNILFRAEHIEGRLNVVADCLSRFQFQQAFLHCKTLSKTPVTVPEHLFNI